MRYRRYCVCYIADNIHTLFQQQFARLRLTKLPPLFVSVIGKVVQMFYKLDTLSFNSLTPSGKNSQPFLSFLLLLLDEESMSRVGDFRSL